MTTVNNQKSEREPLLQISNLTVEVDNFPLLENFNLQIRSGQHIEFRGGNGVGKTTLLRHIAGIRKSPEGTIDRSCELTYVGQSNGLSQTLTPLENLRWFTQLAEIPVSGEDICSALDGMGVGSFLDVPVGSLSSGQQRRCALARLLLNQDSTWILDEPLTALDSEGVKLVKDMVVKHKESSNTSVIATHTSLQVDDTVVVDLDVL